MADSAIELEAFDLERFVERVWAEGASRYRELPWRNIDDAYGVLVSEVMLQQTQVSRVLKHWERFMALFPTIDALAAADTAFVLEQWQGLGYNRRALALKRAAEQCSERYAGALPRTREELGELLLPHDASSVPSLIEKIKGNADILASSPDAALNGNLPKRWTVEDGRRVLVKAGRPSNRFQEPFNEKIASVLCSRLLDDRDFVAYSLEDGGFMKWASRCETMTDQFTEFVPAYALLCSSKRPSDLGLHSFYIGTCAAHGLEVREDIEKMLTIDYLMANFDRHWNNFGILIDTESREWLRAAPIFDTGEALWCDLDISQRFGGYTTPRAGMMRPFARRIDDQLDRYCRDLSWFDPSGLKGFSDQACDILLGNPFIANEPGRIDKIKEAIDLRAMMLARHAREVRRERGFTVPVPYTDSMAQASARKKHHR